jgi:hypothetical protein
MNAKEINTNFLQLIREELNDGKDKKISKMHNPSPNTAKNKEEGENRATIGNLGARRTE